MKRTRLIAGLVLLLTMAAGKIAAQEIPKPPGDWVSQPAKVTIVISEFDGEKKISSLPYVMNMRVERRANRNNQLRMGIRVPIETKGKDSNIQYQDVGTNIDCQVWNDFEGQYKMNLWLERSSLYTQPSDTRTQPGHPELASGTPIFAQFKSSLELLFGKDGQTIQCNLATDPLTGRVIKVDVTLNFTK